MRCDEIQEHLVDLLYDEGDPTPANLEARNHLQTCTACRDELEQMKKTRIYLQGWKDESPLRSVTIARHEKLLHRRSAWKYVRYTAIAAMALICMLALANADIKWNKDGFSFSTHLLRPKPETLDVYTKTETREIIKAAQDDSESRMREITFITARKILDTVEQEQHYTNLHLVRSGSDQGRNRN